MSEGGDGGDGAMFGDPTWGRGKEAPSEASREQFAIYIGDTMEDVFLTINRALAEMNKVMAEADARIAELDSEAER